MKILIALAVCFASVAHATPDDRLAAALHTFRKRTTFVDLSPEGRLTARGEHWLLRGFQGFSLGFADDTTTSLRPVFSNSLGVLMIASVGVIGAGGVMYTAGKLVQVLAPRPRLGIADPMEYASAAGLNQFRRLSFAEQFEIARGTPALRDYLIELEDARELAIKYGLLPAPE